MSTEWDDEVPEAADSEMGEWMDLGAPRPIRGAPPPAPSERARDMRPIVLNTGTSKARGGVLMRLARLYGLDIYGNTALLGGPAAQEMGYAAVALTVVGLFEFSAWTLLFTTMFTIGFGVSPLVLLASVFGAGMLATIIMVFEVTFLTLDPDEPIPMLLGSAARIALILMSAFVTAQPLETVFFHADIEERLLDEALRTEAVSRLRTFDKQLLAATQMERRSVSQSDVVVVRAEDLAAEKGARDAQVRALIESFVKAERTTLAGSQGVRLLDGVNGEVTLRRLPGQLVSAASGNEATYRAKEKACREAAQSVEPSTAKCPASQHYGSYLKWAATYRQVATRAEGVLAEIGGAKAAASTGIEVLQEEKRKAEEVAIAERMAKRQETRDQFTNLEVWMEQAKVLQPGTTLATLEGVAWPNYDAGLTKRLAVIDDLTWCVPPAWPEGSTSTRAMVLGESGLARLKELEEVESPPALLLQWVDLRRQGLSGQEMASALFGIEAHPPSRAELSTWSQWFGLGEPERLTSASVPEGGELVGCYQPSVAKQHIRRWWAAFFIAMSLPAVSLVCKLMFRKLHEYYSTGKQAALGNVDAVQVQNSRREAARVRREMRHQAWARIQALLPGRSQPRRPHDPPPSMGGGAA